MSSGSDRRKFDAAWLAANDDRTPDGQRAECFRFMAKMSQKYDTRAWKAELEAKHGPAQQTQQQAGQQSTGRPEAGQKKQSGRAVAWPTETYYNQTNYRSRRAAPRPQQQYIGDTGHPISPWRVIMLLALVFGCLLVMIPFRGAPALWHMATTPPEPMTDIQQSYLILMLAGATFVIFVGGLLLSLRTGRGGFAFVFALAAGFSCYILESVPYWW